MNNDKSKAMRRLSNALNANDMVSAKKIIEKEAKQHIPKYEYYFYLGLVSDDYEQKLKYYNKSIKHIHLSDNDNIIFCFYFACFFVIAFGGIGTNSRKNSRNRQCHHQ